MKKVILTAILSLLTLQANALITRPVTDDGHINVPIALNNMTQIGVMGGRISQAIGMTSGPGPNTQYALKADSDSGNVFITPETNQAFTLTLKTEQNHFYSITFHPTAMSPETILLVPQSYHANAQGNLPLAEPYETAITQLMRAMVTGTLLQNYAIEHVVQEPIFAAFNTGITLLPVTTYQSGNFTGTIYQVKNTSPLPVNLHEKEFSSQSIIAVALAKHQLMPTQTSWLYEIRNANVA